MGLRSACAHGQRMKIMRWLSISMIINPASSNHSNTGHDHKDSDGRNLPCDRAPGIPDASGHAPLGCPRAICGSHCGVHAAGQVRSGQVYYSATI